MRKRTLHATLLSHNFARSGACAFVHVSAAVARAATLAIPTDAIGHGAGAQYREHAWRAVAHSAPLDPARAFIFFETFWSTTERMLYVLTKEFAVYSSVHRP